MYDHDDEDNSAPDERHLVKTNFAHYLEIEHAHSEPAPRYGTHIDAIGNTMPLRTVYHNHQAPYRIDESDLPKPNCQRNLDFFDYEL